MKLKILTYPLLVLALAGGCKEAVIHPDEVPPLYTLPQGNHAYDAKIVDFYNTYGCYILYKFTDKDFRWNINSNIFFVAEQADENYVEPALTILDDYLFRFYTPELLKKAMPYKLILASRIKTVTNNTTNPPVTLDNYINTTSSYSHLAFGRAGATLPTLTPAQLKTMKAELHREFWKQATIYNKVSLPPAFAAATDYSVVTNVLPIRRANGVFTVPTGNNGRLSVYSDFADYIYNIALQTPQEWEQNVFTSLNDPNGKFRLKYNAIISYFKEVHGVDLQDITK